MAANHQCLDPRRDQRGAVGTVDHFTRRTQFLAERGGLQRLYSDAGSVHGGGVHLDRTGRCFFAAFGVAFITFGMFGLGGFGTRFGCSGVRGFGAPSDYKQQRGAERQGQ